MTSEPSDIMSETEYEEDHPCNCSLIRSIPVSDNEQQQLTDDLDKIRRVISIEEIYAQEIIREALRKSMFHGCGILTK